MIKYLAGAALVFGMTSTSWAGEQYIDNSGYGAGGYDVVSYFSLDQAPVGQKQPEAVPGRADITATYNGAEWAFSSKENRDRFLADPAKYAPQYDGHCAYGVAKGGKVPGNPNLWRIRDGKLYLNITPTVVGFWEENIPGNLTKSEANWTQLSDADASTRSWKSISDNDGTYSVNSPIQ